jgi:3-phosphoshikimate 1-carboxyvinyltransferase
MKYILRAKTHTLKGNIKLPASKSISNRILIIEALAQTHFSIKNLSKAKDTVVLKAALDKNEIITDVGPAGTAMRFLTAFYAVLPGEKILTGSDRMKKRPIKVLVNALRQLGAEIAYLDKEGYPPLRIEGRRLKGGTIKVAGNISSQFITALMLIAPSLPQALTIEIEGDPLSRPYILMTQALMISCGAQVSVDEHCVKIMPGRYRSKDYEIEQDWSAAAFWMTFTAAANKASLTLLNLKPFSIQGDQACIELFQHLGVKSEYTEKGLLLTKIETEQQSVEWNLRDHPDLVQPASVAAAIAKINLTMHGLDNLRLKETDRLQAVENELKKIGIIATVEGHSMTINGGEMSTPDTFFEAYEDHRMVMCLAPLSLIFDEIIIENPLVVSKSYPGFWKEVEKYVDVRPMR